MNRIDPSSLGWGDFFEGARRQAARPDLEPARVSADHGATLKIIGPHGPCTARASPDPPPCVGDWVLAHPAAGDERARIGLILARRTTLDRQASGRRTARQTIAANLDVVFIVTTPDDHNPRRIERYLAAVAGGGAAPVLVSNKSDLPGAPVARPPIRPDVPVVATSAATGEGLDRLRTWLGPGRTGGFVGASGVGKSSLVNALLGTEALAVGRTTADGRGRHTTTHRQLVCLPEDGGVLVDTPGMRELALWDGDGLDEVFADLADRAGGCRFRDCGHGTEPGCALRAAVDAGDLDPGQLDNWLALRKQADRQVARRDVVAERKRRKEVSKRRRKAARDSLKNA